MFMFGQKVTCPHCLAEFRIRKAPLVCTTCWAELPPQYVHDYDAHPPFFTQVFGWSQVGKTVFLQALTLMLVKMANVWPNYAYAAVTDLSQNRISEIREYLERGRLPASTPRGVQDVYIMLLHNMERWGSRALVTRDCAGEIFDTMNIPVDEAPYLLKVPTTFMLIGPPGDPSNAGGRSMDMLLNNYINTLLSRGVNFASERRNLVVVFTKADKIQNLPGDLYRYLEEDPLWAAVNARGQVDQMDNRAMQAYIDQMRQVSDAVREWVDWNDAGKTFLRLAQRKHIDLRFTLISSTGDDVGQNGMLVARLAPRRVLDPYFWALELQRGF